MAIFISKLLVLLPNRLLLRAVIWNGLIDLLDIPFLSGKSANEVKTSSPMIPMSHLKMWNSACACLWLPVLAVPPPLSVAHETGFTSFQGGSYIHSSGKFGAPLNPPKAGPLILHLSSKWLLFVDFKHVQACAGRKRCERMWKNHHFKFQPISMNSARGNKLSTPVARPSRMVSLLLWCIWQQVIAPSKAAVCSGVWWPSLSSTNYCVGQQNSHWTSGNLLGHARSGKTSYAHRTTCDKNENIGCFDAPRFSVESWLLREWDGVHWQCWWYRLVVQACPAFAQGSLAMCCSRAAPTMKKQWTCPQNSPDCVAHLRICAAELWSAFPISSYIKHLFGSTAGLQIALRGQK